jgi:ABC-type microcin C transport system duplicated ATPase subunit YejF
MNEVLLDVQHLSVRFQTENGIVQALDDVAFSIRKGETMAIVGESGSGKSVTALSLMGLLPKTAGLSPDSKMNLHYPEDAVLNLADKNANHIENLRGVTISMIFQEPMTSLNPLMRCGTQVAEQITK